MGTWIWAGDPARAPEAWIAGHIPWPALAADPRNLAPRPGKGENLAPASGAFARANRMCAQNQLLQVLRVRAASAGSNRPSWLQADAVSLRSPHTGRSFTLGGLFRALRARGIQPHALTAAEDGYVAGLVMNSLGDSAPTTVFGARPNASKTVGPGGAATPNGLLQHTPAVPGAIFDAMVPSGVSPFLGIAEGTYPRDVSVFLPDMENFQQLTINALGTYAQMLADVASIGAGRVRRVKQSDIYYQCLFPYDESIGTFQVYGTTVPAPATLLAQIRSYPDGGPTNFARLAPTTALLCQALCHGVKVDLTPFNAGGGAPQNYFGNYSPADPLVVSAVLGGGPSINSATTWGDLQEGAPGWQTGYLIQAAATPTDRPPSGGSGWGSFYWDSAGSGWPSDGLSLHGADQVYQRFVVNVWPTQATADAFGEADSTGYSTAYQRECARRKALGVAQFAQGIGEWLAGVGAALSDCGAAVDVTDVVEVIELGNELNGFWATNPDGGADLVSQGAWECGRYIALIAMPIRMQVPTMRFRTELLSWGYTDAAGTTTNYPNYLAWLRKVIEEGMATEARLWGMIELYVAARALGYTATAPATIEEWLHTIGACGDIAWPPVPTSSSPTVTPIPSVADLIHQVGFHWYHDTNADLNARSLHPPGYAATGRMAQDVSDMVSVVTGPLSSVGGVLLGITVGEIGFPALDPGRKPEHVSEDSWGYYYAGASPELQAAMHLRYLLTLLASGVDSASIFTFSHGDLVSTGTFATTPGASLVNSWTDFATTGIHNEVVYAPATGDPVQGVDAWPRPSWFSFRRLVWLLEHAGATPPARMQIVANSDGLMVVEILFAGPAYLPLAQFETWSRAYFVWIDQYSTAATTATLTFDDAARSGFTLLPMVPTVTPPTSSTPEVDRNGYAKPASFDWKPAGWDSALVSATRSGSDEAFSSAVFSLLVQRTVVELATSGRTSVAIAPLCVLTNANFTGFTWTTP